MYALIIYRDESPSAKISANADRKSWYGSHDHASLYEDVQDADDL